MKEENRKGNNTLNVKHVHVQCVKRILQQDEDMVKVGMLREGVSAVIKVFS